MSLIPARAVLLCGGAGRRMGGDKPGRRLGGTPLWQLAHQQLTDTFAEVLVVGGRASPGAVAWIPDPTPGRGPLEGLRGGLQNLEYEWCALQAVDMPELVSRFWQLLWERRGGTVVLTRAGGRPQPLAALYHRSLAEPLERYLAAGERRVLPFVESHPHVWVEDRDLAARGLSEAHLENLNTPADLERAEARRRPRQGTL